MQNPEVFLVVKDHHFSKEEFNIVKNPESGLLQTEPVPVNLDDYYSSPDYISHTDSKRSFFEKLYSFVKSYSTSKKIRLIKKLNKEKGTLLDVGAGTAGFLVTAKAKNWVVQGIEPNEKAIQLAENKGIKLLKSINSLPHGTTFDVITLWHVLEHLPDVNVYINELKNRLKPNGHLIVAVPNHKSWDAKFYGSFWAGYDVPRHLWHFSRESIQLLFKKHGMAVIKTKPMLFDSLYVSLLSEKYKTGKTRFFHGIFIGLISNIKAFASGEYSSIIYIIKKDENVF